MRREDETAELDPVSTRQGNSSEAPASCSRSSALPRALWEAGMSHEGWSVPSWVHVEDRALWKTWPEVSRWELLLKTLLKIWTLVLVPR